MNATVPNQALQMPRALWVPVVTLAGAGVVQIGFGLNGMMPLVVAGGLAFVLAAGLASRQRWAHVMTLASCVITLLAALAVGEWLGAALIAVFNAVMAVPLVTHRGWYWDRESLPEWLT